MTIIWGALIILLIVGLLPLFAGRSLRRILFGVIVIEYAVELGLVLLGERDGVTVGLVAAVAILLAALVGALKSDDLDDLRELKG